MICRQCGEEKPHYEAGLCHNCYQRNYRKDPEVRRKANEATTIWRKNNPEKIKAYYIENSEKIKALFKKWEQEHAEERKKYLEEWRKRNPENWREWKEKNPEKYKMNSNRRQAKRLRNLNWILMFDNPFDDSVLVDWHHINDTYVVAIPRDLHKLYLGKHHREMIMDIVKQIYLE